MLESQNRAGLLSALECRILGVVEPRSRTEKQISKIVKVDRLVLGPVVTDLILKGYLEIYRKRRFYLFSQEVCTITPEGIAALEASRSPCRMIIETLRKKGLQLVETLAARSPALKVAVGSANTIYRIARALA